LSFIVGIDGGGTKTKAILSDLEGKIISTAVSGPSNFNTISQKSLQENLSSLFKDLCKSGNIKLNEISIACGGFAGLSHLNHSNYQNFFESLTKCEIHCYSDKDMILHSIPKGKEAVIVNCGTGSYMVGKNLQSEIEECGGWGYILGDEASGYFLGLETMKAAAKEKDECREGIFSDLVKEKFKLGDFNEIKKILYGNENVVSDVASLAGDVIFLADEKNKFASSILNKGLIELKFLLNSLESRLKFTSKVLDVFLAGSLFINFRSYVSRFKDILGIKYNVSILELAPESIAIIAGMEKLNILVDDRVKKNLTSSYNDIK